MKANLNLLWAGALVDELHRGGVRLAIVAPGSRSTPLALACAERLEVRTAIDERSAAFVALGAAKATGQAALALATSGSAGAHFYPALLESEASGTPLLVVTADRPPELHGWGAPQTLDQRHLFGAHARDFADVGLPEANDAAFRHLRATAGRAADRARLGPVHLNAPFREPLAPVPEDLPDLRDPPAARHVSAAARPDVSEAARMLSRKPRGVIVCGPRDADDELPSAVAALSRTLGYAVVAEAASQVRFALPGSIAHADSILRDERWARALRPQVVVRVGGGLTSKVLQGFVEQADEGIVVHERGEPVDPAHGASLFLHGPAPVVLNDLAAQARPEAPGPLAALFRHADRRAREALDRAQGAALTEPRVARETVSAMPEGGLLFVASSMPIRDVDAFASPARQGVRVLANRGLNGIDGTISTALGAALASGRPTTVLLGDLALLHDLGGLVAAARLGVPLRLVVVNNDGGGIFHFLPVAHRTERFEELFATPHGLDLSHAAALCGASFARPEDAEDLRGALSSGSGLRLVEVRTDRSDNVDVHRRLHAAVAEALGSPP